MAKKNYWKKSKVKKPRKKYSSEEKYRYHSSREVSCGKYGLEFGGPKHCYSTGFADAFHGIDNTRAINGEFGKHCSNAYASGNKRGKAAAKEYFLRTGKQPSDLRRFD